MYFLLWTQFTGCPADSWLLGWTSGSDVCHGGGLPGESVLAFLVGVENELEREGGGGGLSRCGGPFSPPVRVL